MLVGGFDIKVSFQSAVEEHYFHIEEKDFVVGKGAGKFDSEMQIVEVCDGIIKFIFAMCPGEKYIVDVTPSNQGRVWSSC